MNSPHMLFTKLSLIAAFCGIVLCSCSSSKPVTKQVESSPPVLKATAEFRAAWVATVANINWPSKPGLSTEAQQAEAMRLIDSVKDLHFNAIVLQVRPQADALYKSDLEPWSYYLTGTQGKAPDPFYDPLDFWIKAAHDRGLELHVWLNPYRAHHIAGGPVTESSVVTKMPNLVMKLKEGYWWFDPAQKGTQDHGVAVVMDLVKRYDIDGVHFDDYFYPYPSYNGNADFPDSTSWKAYKNTGGKLSRGDWRRDAVNVFIERLYKEIKTAKPYVKFGLSPFGMYRPGYPASVPIGFDQYAELYADAKLWLNKGWIDYFSPQLYWTIRSNYSFPLLLRWWEDENTLHRHLWPGISLGTDTSARNTDETVNKIMITRGMIPNSPGVVHWHISSVTRSPNMAKALIAGPYRQEALVPSSPWLDNTPPAMPIAKTAIEADSMMRVSWSHPDEKDVFRWVVYYQYGSKWNYQILSRNDRFLLLKAMENGKYIGDIAVTAVDRTGNESARTILKTGLTAAAIIPRSGWNAVAPKPYKSHKPVRITIHHEGTRFGMNDDAAKHIRNVQIWGMGKDRNWSDIPYHFLIAPDGTIYEGRDVFTAGETATEYDPSGHLLITCMGNLEEQEVAPSQLNSLIRLIAYVSRKYQIPYETIASHKDYSRQTSCPGKNLYAYLENGYIKKSVKELILF